MTFGSRTLKDAVNAAIKDWIENVKNTHYLLGSVVGPHPFPTMNRDFQSIVGKEIKQQLQKREFKLPDYVIACVGGGSNAMGAFYNFINKKIREVLLVLKQVEEEKNWRSRCSFFGGSVGVVEGYKSYFLQDADGQLQKNPQYISWT